MGEKDGIPKDKKALYAYQDNELENKITHILNCAGVVCPDYFPDDYVYKTLYLADGKAENIISHIYNCLDFMDTAINSGGRVYVHCWQGVSRSSAFTIAYLMFKNDWPYKQTHEFVKAIRGVANPNTGFMCQLLEWHKLMHSPIKKMRMYIILPHCPELLYPLLAREILNKKASSLDIRSVIILRHPDKFHIWIGSKSKPFFLTHALRCVEQMQRYEKAPLKKEVFPEGEEPEEFWEALGGKMEEPPGERNVNDRPLSWLTDEDVDETVFFR